MTLPTIDTDELSEYLSVSESEPWLVDVLETAIEIIADHLKASGLAKVAASPGTYRTSVLMLAQELNLRRQHAGGLVQSYGADGAVVRLSRDPWVAVGPLLNRYCPLGSSG